MNYKYFLSACLLFQHANAFQPLEYFLAHTGQLTQGPVNASTEAYIFKLCDELHVSKNIDLQKPLESVAKSNAAFNYTNYVAGRLFINEEKINQLSEKEKQFVLGSQLARLKNLDRLRYLRAATALTAFCGSYALGSVYGVSRWLNLPGSFFAAWGIDACADYLAYARVKAYIKKQADKKVIEQFGCQDEAA